MRLAGVAGLVQKHFLFIKLTLPILPRGFLIPEEILRPDRPFLMAALAWLLHTRTGFFFPGCNDSHIIEDIEPKKGQTFACK